MERPLGLEKLCVFTPELNCLLQVLASFPVPEQACYKGPTWLQSQA